MALTNYGELKTSVASWLGRADLTTSVPDFVTLCHKQLMRELRGHLRMQIRNATFNIIGEYVSVPSDFLSLTSMYLNSPKQVIEFLPSDAQTDLFAGGTGAPKYVCVVGTTTPGGTENFRFGPAPSGAYTATIEYSGAVTFFTADSGAGSTNWILTDHPDVYLYGSLLQAAAFIKDDPRVPLWQAGFAAALESCKKAGDRSKWGANAMAVRVA